MSNKQNDLQNQVQQVEGNPIFQILSQIVGTSPLGRIIVLIAAVAVVIFGGRALVAPVSTDPTTNSNGGLIVQGNPGGGGGSVSNPPDTSNTNNAGTQGANGLPAASFKQQAKQITFHGCPPEGDGGDPVLNNNKNRVDMGNFQPVAFNTILNLAWPTDTQKKAHATWSQSSADQVAQAEGLPVAVEGYLVLARQEGPETPNCHSSTDADFHIWLLGQPGGMADRTGAVVVESTPRVRDGHPNWTVDALNQIAKATLPVRISGWLMLDPEHPEQIGKTRGTLWEIHPIMQIEVSQNGKWVSLDNYQ